MYILLQWGGGLYEGPLVVIHSQEIFIWSLPKAPCVKVRIGIASLWPYLFLIYTYTGGVALRGLSFMQMFPIRFLTSRFYLKPSHTYRSKYSRSLRMVRNFSSESWFYLLTSQDSYQRRAEYATPKFTTLAYWGLFWIKGMWETADARPLWPPLYTPSLTAGDKSLTWKAPFPVPGW